jgi:hypothetical protein
VIDASAEQAIRQACVVAVVRVSRIDEECSGLGGAHVTFAVVELGRGSGVTTPGMGGHGYFAPANGPRRVGDYFVAGIDPFGMLRPRPDNPAWCLVGLPAVDGEVHTLVPATGEVDARTRMQAILALP